VRREVGDLVTGRVSGKQTIQGASMAAMVFHGGSPCWTDQKIIHQRRPRKNKSQAP
jgi:hypothetical protein